MKILRQLWRKAANSPKQNVVPPNCLAYQPCSTGAMTDDTQLPFYLPAVRSKKLTVDFDGNQSSGGGLLLLRKAERRLGVCRRLANAMPDRRDPDRIEHQMFELVMARASAIAAGPRMPSTSNGCGTIR
jgi:Transposase DDE domain group 1